MGEHQGLLRGRVAIITGAGAGIGEACAHLFAEHGASVTVADVDIAAAEAVAAAIRSKGGTAQAVAVDVSRYHQALEMVDATLASYGAVHVLVNNAGLMRSTSFQDITDEEWDLLMAVNLKGPFNCSKAVFPVMKRQGYGRIVNVASMAGRSFSPLAGAHYTASKAGLLGLTRHLAREMAPFGIYVNAVCPGATLTRIQLGATTAEEREAKARRIPLGRIADPIEQARVILFLASDWASFVCGATVDVNGGSLMI